jgi:hypothetical protein
MKLIQGICVACLILLQVGCVSNDLPPPSSSDMLVGIWQGDIGFATWVINRRADNTFEERRIQIYSYQKPSVTFTATGTWSLEGVHYVKIYRTASAEVWQPAIGKRLVSKVVKISENDFQYLPADGPLVTERRQRSGTLENLPLALSSPYDP